MAQKAPRPGREDVSLTERSVGGSLRPLGASHAPADDYSTAAEAERVSQRVGASRLASRGLAGKEKWKAIGSTSHGHGL